MGDSKSKRNPIEELADSFVQRYRRGERPSLTEYTGKYPELADEIRELFPSLVMMEELAPESESVNDQFSLSKAGVDHSELKQLGDFRIIREIGRGGMGIVYEAEQLSLSRHVALKVLPKQALLSSNTKRRFDREARAAAKLHHSNIVPVFGVGECEGLHFYAMQFIHGLGLDEVLIELRRLRDSESGKDAPVEGRKGGGVSHVSLPDVAQSIMTETGAYIPGQREGDTGVPDESPPSPRKPGTGNVSETLALSGSTVLSVKGGSQSYWQSVAEIGVQVAEALEYAHEQGVMHRDIKPANLLLDSGGTVWVTDFGLAKCEGQDDLTHTGNVLGTLRYMAPEVFQGEADPRSDVYALGLTLYELLALRPAFSESDRHKLMRQVTVGEPPPQPRKLNPEIPLDLETIVEKAIDRDTTRRYQKAAELAADLRRFMNDEPIRARRMSLPERLVRWSRRNLLIATLTATIALLLVVAAVGFGLAAIQSQRLTQKAESELHVATIAKEAEEKLRKQAEKAKDIEKDRAERRRQRLVRFNVARGADLMDRGDLLGSLPWFVEALRLDQGDAVREEIHRIRLATVLRRCPKLAHVWFHQLLRHAEFSPDGRYVLIVGSRMTRVVDAVTGADVANLHESTHTMQAA